MNLSAYLERINIFKDVSTNIEDLKLIQKQHLLTVPFENLDIHLYNHINLSQEKLFDKIVYKKRGGICYELNYLLSTILKQIGFQIVLLGGKVLSENGTFHDHLFIKVDINGDEFLVDVGFGDNFMEPLEFICDEQQNDLKGLFKIKKIDKSTYKLLKKSNNQWKLEYIFEDEEKNIEEFDYRVKFFVHSDESIFKKNVFCSIEKEVGRLSLKKDKFIITEGEYKREINLDYPEKYFEILKSEFSISLTDNLKKKLFINKIV